VQAIRLEKPREVLARLFVDAAKGVPDVEAAWQGARDIVAERIAEDADVRVAIDRNTGNYESFRRWKVVPDDLPEMPRDSRSAMVR